MKFNHAMCMVCGGTFSNVSQLVAYAFDPVLGMCKVKLKGQQPWAGVHCVCRPCIATLLELSHEPN